MENHTRILIFGSLIIFLVGGGILGLFVFFPKKNDSFLAPVKPTQGLVSSSRVPISSVVDINVGDDKIPSVLSRPATDNFIFVSLSPINYFVQKIADGGIEVIDLSLAPKTQKNTSLSKNDFVYIGKAKGIITGDNIPNQWIKDFYIDPTKKIDLASVSGSPFWLSFSPLRSRLKEIKDFLVQKDGGNKVIYEKNYDRLILKLDGMEEKYKKKLASCSTSIMVENGNSFVGLAQSFNLKHTSIDLLQLQNLDATKIDLIQKTLLKNKTKTLFVVGDYTDAELNIISTSLENIEIIALGDFNSNKNKLDYFDILDRNLERLGGGLGCV